MRQNRVVQRVCSRQVGVRARTLFLQRQLASVDGWRFSEASTKTGRMPRSDARNRR